MSGLIYNKEIFINGAGRAIHKVKAIMNGGTGTM
jgi:hypothetical protein